MRRHLVVAQTHASAADLNLSGPRGIVAHGNLIATSCRPRTSGLVFTYQGWHVEASRAAAVQPPERSIDAICRQIDIIEGVRLSPDILRFMRSVRFWMDPSRKGSAGRYARATGVDFHVRELDPAKPIALHELLHAFHDQCLGFDNLVIRKFYQAALGRSDWPRNAHMLKNVLEFFAMTASAYLFRNIPRPPFSAEQLRQTQPDYYDALSTLLRHARAPFSEEAAPRFGPAHSSAVP